jgi:hypothetical protein
MPYVRPTAFRESDLRRIKPWVGSLKKAHVVSPEEDLYRFAALGLRETEFGQSLGYAPKGDPLGWGDGGHGYGFFQIDKRFHPEFIRSKYAMTVTGQAGYAMNLLRQNREWFQGKGLTGPLLERATYAAYNTNERRVLAAIKNGGNQAPEALAALADSVTTGKDYSGWIFKKADALRAAVPSLLA